VSAAFKEQSERGHQDLESLEFCIRSSMHDVGRKFLEKLLQGFYVQRTEEKQLEKRFAFIEEREKTILTVLGKVKISRAYYYDRKAHEGMCPYDKALDVVGISFSTGMRRIMGRVGAYRSFALGHEDIQELAGVNVTAKEVERIAEDLGKEAALFMCEEQMRQEEVDRIPPNTTMYVLMDGSGVPVVKPETEGRKGKGADGKAKTREAKLGCIFTQTTVDDEGYPVRDALSTTYIGKIEAAEEFGNRLSQEAVRRGIDRAAKVVVLGDAAVWIDNVGKEHFPGATQIVDLYHASEHYWYVARAVFGTNEKKLHEWTKKRKKELHAGDVQKVIVAIKRLNASTKEQQDVCRKEIQYFQNNKSRMHYDRYRGDGLFVGSGVVEAGCRTVVGQRLKQSGMQWTVDGANSILALRCCIFSHRWEDFWAYRAAA
jgi:hypothetical protein